MPLGGAKQLGKVWPDTQALIQMVETVHTGLDRLAEMDLPDLAYWCLETRRYLEAKAEAMKAQI